MTDKRLSQAALREMGISDSQPANTPLPEPTPDELLEEEARKLIAVTPAPAPDHAGLPDDVRDGHIEDTP